MGNGVVLLWSDIFQEGKKIQKGGGLKSSDGVKIFKKF